MTFSQKCFHFPAFVSFVALMSWVNACLHLQSALSCRAFSKTLFPVVSLSRQGRLSGSHYSHLQMRKLGL